ncbi:MAG TPA: hypothetical protein VMR37_01480 [Rhabdochlamydiaceae bacterium]|nr:hypothetical protein [Rhabdochlamydiaceae bacterium]
MSLDTIHNVSVKLGLLAARPEVEVSRLIRTEYDSDVVASRPLQVDSRAFQTIVQEFRETTEPYTFKKVVQLFAETMSGTLGAIFSGNASFFKKMVLQLRFCFYSSMLVKALSSKDPKKAEMVSDFYRSLMFTTLEKAALDRSFVPRRFYGDEVYNRATYIEAAKTALRAMLPIKDAEKDACLTQLHDKFCSQETEFMNREVHMFENS